MNERAIIVLRRNIKLCQKQLENKTHKRYYKQHTSISINLIFVNTKGRCFTRVGFYWILAYIKEKAIEEGYNYDCKKFLHTRLDILLQHGVWKLE